MVDGSAYAGLGQGAGDFGFGANYKQGKSQVQDFMANSGIRMDPSSGAYAGAMGEMTGQALGMDAQARRDYTMNLLRTPLQTMSVAGKNLVPGSPSQFDPNAAGGGMRNMFSGDRPDMTMAQQNSLDDGSYTGGGSGRTPRGFGWGQG